MFHVIVVANLLKMFSVRSAPYRFFSKKIFANFSHAYTERLPFQLNKSYSTPLLNIST